MRLGSKVTEAMKLYFAYGSNMGDAQMKSRCPECKKIGFSTLSGFRWIISARGYANVVESKDDQVEGVLFQISESDERSLDKYEGVASGSYRKVNLPVFCDGHMEVALVYVDDVTIEGTPKREYVRRINAGLSDAQLSEAYVARYVRRFVPAC